MPARKIGRIESFGRIEGLRVLGVTCRQCWQWRCCRQVASRGERPKPQHGDRLDESHRNGTVDTRIRRVIQVVTLQPHVPPRKNKLIRGRTRWGIVDQRLAVTRRRAKGADWGCATWGRPDRDGIAR
eukprot:scaffold19146_cov29-Tisochrysis_lutea.AAC.2